MSSSQSKPRILVAIDWFLPAFKAGGPIRSIANMIEILGDTFEFHVVCSDRDLGDGAPFDRSVAPQVDARVEYLSEDRWTASTWRDLLNEIQPDVLYLNSLYSPSFSRLPLSVARRLGQRVVLAPRGMLGVGALSIKPWRKRVWLHLQKLLGNYSVVEWHASTEAEAEEIRAWFPEARIGIAQNLPVPFQPLPPRPADDSVRLLSIGRVHPIKNYSFGVSLADQLAEQTGREVHYTVVGPLEDKAEARRIQAGAQRATVELTGGLPPQEIPPHIAKSDLVLVPSFNENFGHAVAEAVAHGRPALVSDQTAWTALQPGESVRCLPLDLGSWVAQAQALLALPVEEVLRLSDETYRDCLLNPSHLEAHRTLFSAS